MAGETGRPTDPQGAKGATANSREPPGSLCGEGTGTSVDADAQRVAAGDPAVGDAGRRGVRDRELSEGSAEGPQHARAAAGGAEHRRSPAATTLRSGSWP